MSRLVVMMVTTPRLGKVLIDGDGWRQYGLGFQIGEKLERGRKNSMLVFVQKLLYRACGAPRHEFEEGGGSSAEEKRGTASCCPPREEGDEDDASQIFFGRRGKWAGPGQSGGLLRYGKVQVCFLSFSIFPFTDLYFLFSILLVEFKFEFNSALQIFAYTFNLAITS
jgi:hypothetical protein